MAFEDEPYGPFSDEECSEDFAVAGAEYCYSELFASACTELAADSLAVADTGPSEPGCGSD